MRNALEAFSVPQPDFAIVVVLHPFFSLSDEVLTFLPMLGEMLGELLETVKFFRFHVQTLASARRAQVHMGHECACVYVFSVSVCILVCMLDIQSGKSSKRSLTTRVHVRCCGVIMCAFLFRR